MHGLSLLLRRNFSLLWIAGLVSLTGDWLLGIALPIYVYKLTGSPAATSAVVAVSVAAALIAGVFAGVYVDRWDRRRVLIVANLLQVGAVLPLLFVDTADRVWIVLTVAFVESALAQFVAPAEHALLPSLVGDADLAAANSLNTLNRNLARLVGPALGAVVATTLGLSGAAVLDALSFGVAAILVALIARGSFRAAPAATGSPAPAGDRGTDPIGAPALPAGPVDGPTTFEPLGSLSSPAAGTAAEPIGQVLVAAPVGAASGRLRRLPRADRVSALARWRAELVEGVRALSGCRPVRALMIVLAVSSVGEGIMGSLFAVFAARGLRGGASDIGWLMSAQAVGGIVGGFIAVGIAARLRPIQTVVIANVLFGLIDVAIFNLPRFTDALGPQLVLFVLVGIPGAIGVAGAMTLLQTEIVDGLRGRVFAAFGVVQAAGALVGATVAASLTDRFGVFTVLTAQGSGYIVAAVAFALLVRAPRPRRTAVQFPVGGSSVLLSATASREAFQRRWSV